MKTTVYTLQSSTSSRKAIAFLEECGINFEEQKMMQQRIDFETFVKMARLCEESLEEIMAVGSGHFKNLIGDRFESMTLREIFDITQINPRVLKAPIIIQGEKMVVGFDPERTSILLPRTRKKLEISQNLERCRALVDYIPEMDKITEYEGAFA
jgi:regulatory protein spx